MLRIRIRNNLQDPIRIYRVTEILIAPLDFTDHSHQKVKESHKYWRRNTCFLIQRSLHVVYRYVLLQIYLSIEKNSFWKVKSFGSDPNYFKHVGKFKENLKIN